MPKARKNHICTLCFKVIETGKQYIYETIKPWSHPDNDTFGVFKAHSICNDRWLDVGRVVDWVMPLDKYEWEELYGGSIEDK